MKNVLLATTAIALTAGYAAADVSYSASAKLSYGNFGEQVHSRHDLRLQRHIRFRVSGSGEAGGVAYSASMTIDEDAAQTHGRVLNELKGLTFAMTQMTSVVW